MGENKYLRKENAPLKDRLTKIEQAQLGNNVIITGIQEGAFEPYHTMKLCVQEMIARTIDSGDASADLETAKNKEITCCSRVGKFRHNRARPISVTFMKQDEKEALLSHKRKLPKAVYANEEYLLHVKRNRDQLRPILRLAKTLPQYREKSRLEGDRLIINGTHYSVDDLANLPTELATYQAAEKSNETHLVFAGELSPYSNFHPRSFVIKGQHFHSSEQWVQYQKALTFGDSYVANKILNSETAIECKCLSYQINGMDNNKWCNEGYKVCYDGIREKFVQNPSLLSMLKATSLKILAEATTDRQWGTGIALRDSSVLGVDKWTSIGWLSCMLLTIRTEH